MSGRVTVPAGQGPDPVTPERVYTKIDIHAALLGVTPEAAAPAPAVTPSEYWKLVLTDCIQARQEVLGVMTGMDGMPHLHRFPQTKIHVLDAFHDLRRAMMNLDSAIKEIQTEFPERP